MGSGERESKRASKQVSAVKRSEAHEQSEQCKARKRVSCASERGYGGANDKIFGSIKPQCTVYCAIFKGRG